MSVKNMIRQAPARGGGPAARCIVPRAVCWFFRDRRTGRYVMAQPPNTPLVVWAGTAALGGLLPPGRPARKALAAVRDAALLVWAGDELVRGVNPWRRTLGAGVLVAFTVSRRASRRPAAGGHRGQPVPAGAASSRGTSA